MQVVVTAVQWITIFDMDGMRICLEGYRLNDPAMEAFAKADGFTDSEQMYRWFDHEHNISGRPFYGIVIHWRPA